MFNLKISCAPVHITNDAFNGCGPQGFRNEDFLDRGLAETLEGTEEEQQIPKTEWIRWVGIHNVLAKGQLGLVPQRADPDRLGKMLGSIR